MKKIVVSAWIFGLLVACGGSSNAPQKPTSSTPANVTQYMKTITESELKTHLTIVASDAMEGRETGSEGQKKAGLYLIEQYRKNGIPAPKN